MFDHIRQHQEQAKARIASAYGFAKDDTYFQKGEGTPSKEELIDEHKKLVKVLESPDHEDDKKEAEKQKKELEDLEKGGGEGSKGGVVIGRTKSGKPIYRNFNHKDHGSFTKEDHEDAVDAHSSTAMKTKDDDTKKKWHRQQANEHHAMVKHHSLKKSEEPLVFSTPLEHQEILKSQIASIYGGDQLSEIESERLEKGKKAMIGEKRTYNGKDYIKTAAGWRPVGKNKGKIKDAHDTLHGKKVDIDESIHKDSKLIAEHSGMSHEEYQKLHPDTKKELATNYHSAPKDKEKVSKKKEEKDLPEINDTVKLIDAQDMPFSLTPLAKQRLTVVGYEPGTLTAPKFLIVEDESGKKHSINPNYVEHHKSTSSGTKGSSEKKDYYGGFDKKTLDAKSKELFDKTWNQLSNDTNAQNSVLQNLAKS